MNATLTIRSRLSHISDIMKFPADFDRSVTRRTQYSSHPTGESEHTPQAVDTGLSGRREFKVDHLS